jgi:hypothetical protein
VAWLELSAASWIDLGGIKMTSKYWPGTLSVTRPFLSDRPFVSVCKYKTTVDSIRVKCEFDSNVIDESDLEYEKHFDSRGSTFFEIKID